MASSLIHGVLNALTEKLSGAENYSTWADTMQHVFTLYKLWGYITDKIAKPDDTEPHSVKDTYQENLDNALAIINLVVIPIVRINIKKSTTPKDAWDTLSNLHASSNDARIIQLFRGTLYPIFLCGLLWYDCYVNVDFLITCDPKLNTLHYSNALRKRRGFIEQKHRVLRQKRSMGRERHDTDKKRDVSNPTISTTYTKHPNVVDHLLSDFATSFLVYPKNQRLLFTHLWIVVDRSFTLKHINWLIMDHKSKLLASPIEPPIKEIELLKQQIATLQMEAAKVAQ
eukprot:Gb_07825 [translate_table: standard]